MDRELLMRESGANLMWQRMSIPRLIFLILASSLAPAVCAVADPITFQFTVEVLNTDAASPFFEEFVGARIAAGDTFTGVYTFDSAAPRVVDENGFVSYDNHERPYGMVLDIGSRPRIDNLRIGLQQGEFGSSYSVLAVLPDASGSIGFSFVWPADVRRDGLTLPIHPPDIASATSFNFFNGGDVTGRITSLTEAQPAATPEPSAIHLLTIGMFAAAARRHSHV